MTKNIQFIKELFKFPEGKQFLAACILTIMALCTVIVYLNWTNKNERETCQAKLEKINRERVEHLIDDTRREEAQKDRELRKRDRLDSIEEILNLKYYNTKKYKRE